MTRVLPFTLAVLLLAGASPAQHQPGYNYDEANIPPYTPLDPLRLANNQPVTNAKQWTQERRSEILRLFEQNVFGRTPDTARHAIPHIRVLERDDHALNGLAVREQIELSFDPAPGLTPPSTALRTLRLLLYTPAAATGHYRRVPVILGPNFFGNQTVLDDPGIQPTPVWTKPKGTTDLTHALPADSTRGSATQQWQVRLVLERGYGLATFCYGDLEPDFKDALQYSARQLFSTPAQLTAPDAWGAIGLWAWGLDRALAYLVTNPLVDPAHVAVTGHSRMGKTADWAAAQQSLPYPKDKTPHFAAILSTESGHGGQSIQRRALGETVAHLEGSFPYWFAPAYAQWVGHDADIPADGNLLLSLLAPRPVYVASAVGDEWSDPKGEFLSALSASRVYRLLGAPALPADTPYPPADQPLGLDTKVAYHVRTGKHDVTRFDWEHYLDFLDQHWGKPATTPATAATLTTPATLPPQPPTPQTPSSRPKAAGRSGETPVFLRTTFTQNTTHPTQAPSSRPEAHRAAVERPALEPATAAFRLAAFTQTPETQTPSPVGAPPPPSATHPASIAQMNEYRQQLRRALYIPDPLPAPSPTTYSTFNPTPEVTAEKVSYTTGYHLRVPAVIYRPTHPPAHRLPAIVVVNGHGADKSSWYSYYTGILYASAGAVVLTYDPLGEGERNDDHKDFTGEHDRLITEPASMPVRLGGLMVTDVLAAVSYLGARPDVDPNRLAVLGFSMGSFISSLAGAADPRIHALLLVGGGDLDGPGGYWDAGHAVMCQAAPYKALSFFPDRPAVLFTLNARRGDTFIVNGTADTVVDIPHHGPDFFAALRTRTVALNGGEKGIFTTLFDPGASHRPSWITPAAATWLNAELHFPNWKGKDVATLPTTTIRAWAENVGYALGKSSGREDRDAGIVALAADVPLLAAAQLDILPLADWQAQKDNFVYATWVARATAAAR